jgi:RNA polymerase sigma-70 factor (ECF subfamily)
MSGEDRDLVRRCLEGSREALASLVERYQRPLFNAARRMLNDDEEARDVTQAVFVKAWENLGGFDADQKLFSWLYRIAVNESLDLLARRKRFAVLPEGYESRSEERSPEETLSGSELGIRVQEALMELGADHRAVVVLRHFQHCSYREMAYILDIPEKTVKSRLFTARRRLRELLAARGVV